MLSLGNVHETAMIGGFDVPDVANKSDAHELPHLTVVTVST